MALRISGKSSDIVTSSSDTSITLTGPNTLKAGDLLLAIIGCSDTRTCTAPAGWSTKSTSINTGKCRLYVFSKMAEAGDVSKAFNFTFNGNYSSGNGVLFSISDANPDTIGIVNSFGNDNSAEFSATTTADDSLLLYALTSVYAGTATSTLKSEHSAKTTSSYLLAAFSEDIKNPGSVSRTIALNSIYWAGAAISIQPLKTVVKTKINKRQNAAVYDFPASRGHKIEVGDNRQVGKVFPKIRTERAGTSQWFELTAKGAVPISDTILSDNESLEIICENEKHRFKNARLKWEIEHASKPTGDISFFINGDNLHFIKHSTSQCDVYIDGRKYCKILPPLWIDSDGRTYYGDQNIVNGELVVTLPTEWLATAKFPVVLDPEVIMVGEVLQSDSTLAGALTVIKPAFTIDSSTGEITIMDTTSMAVGQTWEIIVGVTDASSNYATGTITVELGGVLVASEIASSSTITGSLTKLRSLAGSLDGTGQLSGTLALTTKVSSSLDGSGDFAGSLSVTRKLSGVLTSDSILSPTLTAGHQVDLLSDFASASSLVGRLSVTKRLTSTIAGDGDLAGRLINIKSLVGGLAGNSAFDVVCHAVYGNIGSLECTGGISGSLSTTKKIVGLLASSSELTARITLSGVLYNEYANFVLNVHTATPFTLNIGCTLTDTLNINSGKEITLGF